MYPRIPWELVADPLEPVVLLMTHICWEVTQCRWVCVCRHLDRRYFLSSYSTLKHEGSCNNYN